MVISDCSEFTNYNKQVKSEVFRYLNLSVR